MKNFCIKARYIVNGITGSVDATKSVNTGRNSDYSTYGYLLMNNCVHHPSGIKTISLTTINYINSRVVIRSN